MIKMTAFDKAWGVAKYDDDDPECGDCGVPIPNGNQYGCERCGKDICEECMTDDQWGYPGYRGDMDDDIHPAYNEVMSQSGAHCPECASKIVEDYDDEQKERMEEEAEEEALRQLEEASIRNDQNELDRKLSEQPFFGDNRGKMLGQNESPHFHSKFHPDWQDLNRSKDSFESAWGIAKAAPIDECKGCGLAHGTPNSEYCSEICEMQNKNKKVNKAADWDTSFKPNATWSQEDIDRLNARNDKAREALRNRTPLPTKSNENALDRALSRARRENAKPKPKLRITRPEDWE
jgi:hypothetical protein